MVMGRHRLPGGQCPICGEKGVLQNIVCALHVADHLYEKHQQTGLIGRDDLRKRRCIAGALIADAKMTSSRSSSN